LSAMQMTCTLHCCPPPPKQSSLIGSHWEKGPSRPFIHIVRILGIVLCETGVYSK